MNVNIGPSDSNIKIINLNKTFNKYIFEIEKTNYPDEFKTWVTGNQLHIQRTDKNEGWGYHHKGCIIDLEKQVIPKLFYQSWCSKSNPSSKIPDAVLNKTISNIPSDCEYKCYTLIEIRQYLSDKWGNNYVELFDKYKKIPHKIDLWRYCILYDTGGTYMDADCVLNSKIHFLYNYNMVFVTNNRSIEDMFNGFIMVKKGNIIMKEMISYMLRVGTSIEDDYYYNCKKLYRVVNKYININNKTYNYKSSIGKVCLLIDKPQRYGRFKLYKRYHAYYKNKNVLVETNDLYPYK